MITDINHPAEQLENVLARVEYRDGHALEGRLHHVVDFMAIMTDADGFPNPTPTPVIMLAADPERNRLARGVIRVTPLAPPPTGLRTIHVDSTKNLRKGDLIALDGWSTPLPYAGPRPGHPGDINVMLGAALLFTPLALIRGVLRRDPPLPSTPGLYEDPAGGLLMLDGDGGWSLLDDDTGTFTPRDLDPCDVAGAHTPLTAATTGGMR